MEEPVQDMWEEIKELALVVYQWFTTDFVFISKRSYDLIDIILFFFSIILLVYFSGKFRKLLVNQILSRYNLDIGIRQSIGTIVRYILLVLGFTIIIQSAGIDLSSLTVLAGALGVGLGFGLQNIANNFISGLIILFERPIKVGDRIEVGDVTGDVVNISARATTIITNDNISIIVPNSEFISSRVTNWSHHDRLVRFRFPVGVSYMEDPEEVKKLLMEVMGEHPGILKNPAPDVWFDEFGDSSLNFNLMVWTSQYVQRPRALKSQLYYSVFKKFKEHGIEIPFPQRDLHIRSGELPVELKNQNGIRTHETK
uniref:Mechanosensitive ion channel n=1 Tax=Roseihalotalea indica TaxID=2867963 RepID=A0AA49JIS4_9BACT|nr:mechanosensitive ion channel [Tunicatimonas sp. TK19036]